MFFICIIYFIILFSYRKNNKITITFDGGGKLILMSKMGTDKTGHNKAEIYIW